MTLTFYNTAKRGKEKFEPLVPGEVSLYVCGPTVYDLPHIGNARAAVAFDVLYRVLKQCFAKVTYVRNITDVEDKIIRAAAENGEPIASLTARTEQAYLDDMRALGVSDPTLAPRVTEHIDDIVAMIETLIAKDHAYEAEGHVLFHVPSMPDYGSLSGRSIEDMIDGARIEVAPYKRYPGDFVLWKPSTPDIPGWDSPWGRGRPGWHIECSAMIARTLGVTIDIHGGGNDLTFPHHENEIAQSVCAHDAPLARYWLHNGMLTVDGEKMSKSLGNFKLLHEVLEQAPAEAIRLYMLTGHYRQPLDWTDSGLAQARATLDRFYLALRRVKNVEADAAAKPVAVMDALVDDLNTPLALAGLHALVTELNKAVDEAAQSRLKGAILASGALLGLLGSDPEAWLSGDAEGGPSAAEVEEKIAARLAARKNKDFAAADRIRDELAAVGVVLEDAAGATSWRRVGSPS
jgi:cysteinyl-tRNA synthetase